MAKLNDLILSEGVERLESESSRTRFFGNLKKLSIDCDEEYLANTIHDMRLPSTDDDAQNIEVDDNLCNEANCPALSMMAAILDSKGIDVSEYEVEVEKDC